MTNNNCKSKQEDNKADLIQIATLTTRIMIIKYFNNEPEQIKKVLQESTEEQHQTSNLDQFQIKKLAYFIGKRLKQIFETKILTNVDFESIALELFKLTKGERS
jgi:hypothetical protein